MKRAIELDDDCVQLVSIAISNQIRTLEANGSFTTPSNTTPSKRLPKKQLLGVIKKLWEALAEFES